MTKKEKVNFVIKTLNNLYPEIPVPLDHRDPYTLLIAVLLSAQCTDVRVNQITPILFSKADNPYDMIKMSIEDIKSIIRPCGLSPMKSKGIYGLSKILIDFLILTSVFLYEVISLSVISITELLLIFSTLIEPLYKCNSESGLFVPIPTLPTS